MAATSWKTETVVSAMAALAGVAGAPGGVIGLAGVVPGGVPAAAVALTVSFWPLAQWVGTPQMYEFCPATSTTVSFPVCNTFVEVNEHAVYSAGVTVITL